MGVDIIENPPKRKMVSNQQWIHYSPTESRFKSPITGRSPYYESTQHRIDADLDGKYESKVR